MIEIKGKSLKKFSRDLNNIGAALLAEAGKIKRQFTPILTHGGNLIRNEIIKSMQATPRMSEDFKRYGPKRTVRSSAPGSPPAIDTGDLVRGVIYNVSPMELEVGVVSTGLGRKTRGGFTSYAEILELTEDPKIKRPFLAPAIEKHEDGITNNMMTVMSRHIIKAVGKGAR